MCASLKGSRILIVGGSSGIGLAVAKRANQEEAQILIASRTAKEKHGFLAEEIDKGVSSYSFDVTSETETEKMLEEIGRIDHLVISVRPTQPDSTVFPDIEIKQAKLAFEIKFWGQYQLIQKACRYINRHGSIVLVTGIAGEKIYKGASTMAIINSATEALCRSLAVELAPIRVNAVSPGFMAPKPSDIIKLAEQFPAGVVGRSENVADAFIFLMRNSYVTGTSVVVDGGARFV